MFPSRSFLPDRTELVRWTFESPVSRAEARLYIGKQKHATTVYHVIWGELSEGTLTVTFIEKKEKTRTVRIVARLWETTEEEAAKWVEGLLNVAYKGAVSTSRPREVRMNSACCRCQAEKKVEVVCQSVFRQGEHPPNLQ